MNRISSIVAAMKKGSFDHLDIKPYEIKPIPEFERLWNSFTDAQQATFLSVLLGHSFKTINKILMNERTVAIAANGKTRSDCTNELKDVCPVHLDTHPTQKNEFKDAKGKTAKARATARD